MHQHPFEAPALANRFSSAGQRSTVTGLIVKSIMASSSASAAHPFLLGPAGRASLPRSAPYRRGCARPSRVSSSLRVTMRPEPTRCAAAADGPTTGTDAAARSAMSGVEQHWRPTWAVAHVPRHDHRAAREDQSTVPSVAHLAYEYPAAALRASAGTAGSGGGG